MRKSILWLFFTFILCGLEVIGQKNYEVEFGIVLPKAFQDTYEDLDNDPHAVILHHKKTSKFMYKVNRGFEIESVYHVRIHILKKSELERGNITLYYYKGTKLTGDKLYKIEAATYNLEHGKVVKTEMDKNAIFDEEINENYAEKKFSLPAVKEGSIIEYTFTKRVTLAGQSSPKNWYFQTDIPVRWSELNIEIPNFFNYQIILGGYLPLAINEQKTERVRTIGTDYKPPTLFYKLAVANAPAFKNESFTTIPDDNVSKVEFELSSVSIPGRRKVSYNTTWDELDQTVSKSNYWVNYLCSKEKLENMAAPFEKIAGDKEKVKAIYDFMVHTYKWNDYMGVWSGGEISKVLEEKKGSASALNLLTMGILQAAGFNANPVIISTRNNGKVITEYPLLDRFNYTIVSVMVGNEKLFIDVTDPLLPMGVLPNRCLSALGREINDGKGYFVDIKSTGEYWGLEEVKASFDVENASLIGNYAASSRGYAANNIRSGIKKSGEDVYRQALFKSLADWEINNFELDSVDQIDNAVINRFSFVKEDDGIMEDMIYLNPMIFGKIKENPFKSKTREFPIDFGFLTNQSYRIDLDIPEGFEVEEVPESIYLKLPNNGGRYIYNCAVNNSKVTIMSRLLLGKAIFPANEYVLLKEFYDRIVAKHAEQIVLSKKQ
ncbi:transglutaminase domain-containing protein [Arcticibacterium luteifluviistationis]|uniref:Uncharacterized protein n=1 Tax=Arcticibacterium luteifluviistationis TaxID=1784714 RepID=A0A2Z4GA39_9BACT|nr:DUF3857 domain-containing protein [Arcticibacterium luteifluviistationis]AWV98067.1 hypothetical protein DJ013_07730 [Arcticibacterium luteifluviistationis]